jgi:gluconate 5-dehydrogenase
MSGVAPERENARFPTFALDGKVVIVTGASSGIGFAIAQAMSDAGARVVATGRDE